MRNPVLFERASGRRVRRRRRRCADDFRGVMSAHSTLRRQRRSHGEGADRITQSAVSEPAEEGKLRPGHVELDRRGKPHCGKWQSRTALSVRSTEASNSEEPCAAIPHTGVWGAVG